MKLNVSAFAVTCGLLWGLGLFLGTLWIVLVGGATGEVDAASAASTSGTTSARSAP